VHSVSRGKKSPLFLLNELFSCICIGIYAAKWHKHGSPLLLKAKLPKPRNPVNGFCIFTHFFPRTLSGTIQELRPFRLAYQPLASSTFLPQQTSHQQPASSTLLSEQTSTSHQTPANRTGC
jgi:hypothetical protein